MSEDELRALFDTLDFEAAVRGAFEDLRNRLAPVALPRAEWALVWDLEILMLELPDLNDDKIEDEVRRLGW